MLNSLAQKLKECGVVGAGGAGFPTYAKLDNRAEIFIVNCAECEPLLKLHRQLLQARTHEILCAVREITHAIGAKIAYIAIKSHYTEALEALSVEQQNFPEIQIHKLDSVYPSGDELLLIKEVTGLVVEAGKLPISKGVIVNNVETVYNVYRALKGVPVTEKFVSVLGEIASPKTILAPIGTKISTLISYTGGTLAEKTAIISGGPMMGKIVSENDVVTKTTNAIIVLPADHTVVLSRKQNSKILLKRAMSACCQCRMCSELCPRNIAGYPIEPHMVMRILSNGGKGQTEKIYGSAFCSGCGLCAAYSCPMGLSPKALIDQVKAVFRDTGADLSSVTMRNPAKNESNKKVSVARLTSRLALTKYDKKIPFSDSLLATDNVKIPLSQHIGAPAIARVKIGDIVEKNDIIADAADGKLSVNIHASISGKIEDVTNSYILISAR